MKPIDILLYPALIITNIIILYNSFFITDNYLIISFLNLIPKEYIESTITSLFLFPFLNAIPDFFSYIISMEKQSNELSVTINILLGSGAFVSLIGLSIIAHKEPSFILNTQKIRKYILSVIFALLSLLSLLLGISYNFKTIFFLPCCIVLYTLIIFLQELSGRETHNDQSENVVEDLERAIHINRSEDIKPDHSLWLSLLSVLEMINKIVCKSLEYCIYIDLKNDLIKEKEKTAKGKTKYLKIGCVVFLLGLGNYLYAEKINLKMAACLALFVSSSVVLYIAGQENTILNFWNLLVSIGMLYLYIFVLFYTINRISSDIGLDGKSLVVLITSWENGIGDIININSLVKTNTTLALYSTINNFLFNYLVVFCLTESIFSMEKDEKLNKECVGGLIVFTIALGVCFIVITGYLFWANTKKARFSWIVPLGLYAVYSTISMI
eukprot:GAHX01002900.1.p1 GENE.GAHX01002900.1~~GAHX01002900.1.p1  ORF type:complete len:440 (+),score=55.56 GAHX01002900.1:35-1354(+)